MRFTYCPHCGSELTKKEIGDEGLVPFCESCKVPLFDMFSTCVICSVTNEQGEVALLKQTNLSATRYVCVSGFMKIGESAEESAAREIEEEIGQKVESLRFVRSYPYEQKEMLMLGFHAKVKKSDMVLSVEVEDAEWVPFADALGKIREGSIAWQLVKEVIETETENELVSRIKRMEQYFDEITEVTKTDSEAVYKDEVLQKKWQALLGYYENGQWLRDYEADERGELPKELKRGVLSQDGVYNLISKVKE